MTTRTRTEFDPRPRIRRRQGVAIRRARERRGMTMDELARTIGVTVGAISQWETGRFSPRQHHQVALACALGVPWSSLFGLDHEHA